MTIEEDLRKIISIEDYHKVKDICKKGADYVFEKTKANHIKKFDWLVKKQSTHSEKNETKATKNNWVINKSSTALLPEEKEVLELGLNFAPTPKRVPVIDILAGVEIATRRAKLQVEVQRS